MTLKILQLHSSWSVCSYISIVMFNSTLHHKLSFPKLWLSTFLSSESTSGSKLYIILLKVLPVWPWLFIALSPPRKLELLSNNYDEFLTSMFFTPWLYYFLFPKFLLCFWLFVHLFSCYTVSPQKERPKIQQRSCLINAYWIELSIRHLYTVVDRFLWNYTQTK